MESGQRLVLARVTQTWGSSPRPAGSCMVISEKLEMAGSVSGGCVEGAVLKEAKKILEGGQAKKLSYGVADEDAWAVGLSCGGKIDVFVQPWFSDSLSERIFNLLKTNTSFSQITRIDDLKNIVVVLDDIIAGDDVNRNVKAKAIETLKDRIPFQVLNDDGEYLIHSFPRKSSMIIIGAAHVTSDLVALAGQFNFETTVIDPRGVFAQKTIFTTPPGKIMEKYPSDALKDIQLDTHTYAVVLSHDPKIDDDALKVLLKSDVAYIGALGSKKNHEKRISRLLELGFSADDISRINAPIGVDINAVGAKEIALSILAAVIQKRNENLRK